MVGQSQKLDAIVDGKLCDDINLTSIFNKVIGHKLSDGYIGDLYTRFRMIFADNPVQTQIPQFMDLGLFTINVLDESSVISTPNTRIQRPTDGVHWRAPDHVFDGTTADVVSEAKYDYNYNYKTEFQIWK